MVNQQPQKINIRGIDHYYQWIRQSNSSESKPVMVFIHGWGGSSRYWYSTAQELSTHFDCLLYDLRGFGQSLLPSPNLASDLNLSYALEEYAIDLAILLDSLKLDTVFINSHSMGASVATFFLNLYPKRVEKAILTCNGIFEYKKWAFKIFHIAGGYVVKFRYGWFLNVPFADKLFMTRFLHRPIARELSRAFLEDFLMASPEAARETIYTSVSKQAVEVMPQQFAKLSVPTLLISGEKDIIIPASMGRKASELNEIITYVEIPNTAHFPMLEDAPTYMATVNQFLELNNTN